VIQDVPEPGGTQLHVQRHPDRPGLRQGEQQRQSGGAVGQHDGDPIAPPDAEAPQPGRDAVGLVVQMSEAEHLALKAGENPLAVQLRQAHEALDEPAIDLPHGGIRERMGGVTFRPAVRQNWALRRNGQEA
jgi:hypothetical protein